MTLDEFRKEFIESVKAKASADHDFQLSAFVDAAVETLVDAGEITDFEACHYRGVGARKRSLWVDGFSFDDVDGSFRLIVADWTGEDETATLTQSDAKTILGRATAFIEEARAGKIHDEVDLSTEVSGLSRSLYERRTGTTRYRIYLVSDSKLSEKVKDWPEGEIGGVPVEFHIWDVSRIHRVAESKTGRDDLQVDFTKYHEGGIPCLAASIDTNEYKAYLCVIPAKVLADLYNEYGSRLLEGNVRSFLSAKGKVNKGIRNTLVNEPGMFFAYNNGIAATATEVEVEDGRRGLRLLKATDLKIVNGGQTTVSLANAITADPATLEGVFAQVKLSVVSPEKSGEVIPLIAKYANSQNKVSEADFFSNHEFHRRIEQISRRAWAPAVGGAQHETHWFYERARGQFINEQSKLTRPEKHKFLAQNPRGQLITKTDLAKVENAWRCLPHTVSLGAQKNFMAFAVWITELWEKSNAHFNDEYFRRIVGKTILFRQCEKIVSQQDWYQGGYRANIVAYAVAKLSAILDDAGKAIDYAELWSQQVLSPALERQLATTAKSVFDVIVTPPTGIQNVTEWSKKELCWQRVHQLAVPILAELGRELLDEEADRSRRDEARTAQGAENRIAAQIDVMNLGSAFWSELLAWSRSRNLLSGEQFKMLSIAAKMPMAIPTERQSIRLLELKVAMEGEGFRPDGERVQ